MLLSLKKLTVGGQCECNGDPQVDEEWMGCQCLVSLKHLSLHSLQRPSPAFSLLVLWRLEGFSGAPRDFNRLPVRELLLLSHF